MRCDVTLGRFAVKQQVVICLPIQVGILAAGNGDVVQVTGCRCPRFARPLSQLELGRVARLSAWRGAHRVERGYSRQLDGKESMRWLTVWCDAC